MTAAEILRAEAEELVGAWARIKDAPDPIVNGERIPKGTGLTLEAFARLASAYLAALAQIARLREERQTASLLAASARLKLERVRAWAASARGGLTMGYTDSDSLSGAANEVASILAAQEEETR